MISRCSTGTRLTLEGMLLGWMAVGLFLVYFHPLLVQKAGFTRTAVYLGVFIPLILLLSRGYLRRISVNLGLLFILAFVLFQTASAYWSTEDLHTSAKTSKRGFILIGVITATYIVLVAKPYVAERLLLLGLVPALISALATVFTNTDILRERPFGIAGAHNPNLLAYFCGFSAVVCLACLYARKPMAVFLPLSLVFLSFLYLSASRGLFFATLVAGAAVLFFFVRTGRPLFSGGRGWLNVAVFLVPLLALFVALLESRGLDADCRWELISSGLVQFREFPLAGIGLSRLNNVGCGTYMVDNTHNFYLEALRLTGLIGGGLLAIGLALVMYYALRLLHMRGGPRGEMLLPVLLFALLLFGLLGWLSTGRSIAEGPILEWAGTWLIFTAIAARYQVMLSEVGIIPKGVQRIPLWELCFLLECTHVRGRLVRKLYRKSLSPAFRHNYGCGAGFSIKCSGDLAETAANIRYEVYWCGKKLYDIAAIEKRHLARTDCSCYILGAGPSLADLQAGSLENGDIIATNGSILFCAWQRLRANYFCVQDPNFIESSWNIFIEGLEHCEKLMLSAHAIAAVCRRDPGVLRRKPCYLFERVNCAFLEPRLCYRDFSAAHRGNGRLTLSTLVADTSVGWSDDPRAGSFSGRSIVFSALQLAHWLGYSAVILAGVDMRVDTCKPRFYHVDKPAVSHINGHFETAILPAFQLAQEILRARGCRVFNLSDNSRLPHSLIPKPPVVLT